jgi:hypothetical protein
MSANRHDPKLVIVLGLAVVALVLLLTTALSILVESRKVDTSTSPWTKGRLIALFDETIDLVGGGNWSSYPASDIDCTTVQGEPGVQYSLLLIGPGAHDADEMVAKVRALWDKRGIPTSRATFPGLPKGTVVENATYPLDKHRFTVAFDASLKSMALDGQSGCKAVPRKTKEQEEPFEYAPDSDEPLP